MDKRELIEHSLTDPDAFEDNPFDENRTVTRRSHDLTGPKKKRSRMWYEVIG